MLPVHERLECDWECLTSDLISAGMAFNGYHCPRFISWFVHRSKSQSHSCFVILSFTQTNSTNKQLHQAGVSIQFSWNFRLNLGICWLWGLCWKSTCLDIVQWHFLLSDDQRHLYILRPVEKFSRHFPALYPPMSHAVVPHISQFRLKKPNTRRWNINGSPLLKVRITLHPCDLSSS